ncbi:MAG: hypothetical protein PVF52_00465 [Granulosicoccaceae bacterium]|jgi:hypothetical protein
MRFPLQQLSLAGLLAGGGLLQAGPAAVFAQENIEPVRKDCQILEFVCATCGHMLDDENWDDKNRWRADIEQCTKQDAAAGGSVEK